MQRRGLPAELRVGVDSTDAAEPLFHAWVEYGGQVVNDTPDVATQYNPFVGAIDPHGAKFQ